MSDKPDFDPQTVHRYFAATCFNLAWEYIDRPERTEEQGRAMLQAAMTSLWHWTQREDASPRNLSVGHWQVSRAFALLGQADLARRYAEISLALAGGEGPFHLGYAHEALTRAEMAGGNLEKAREHLARARACAAQVEDAEERDLLEADLRTME